MNSFETFHPGYYQRPWIWTKRIMAFCIAIAVISALLDVTNTPNYIKMYGILIPETFFKGAFWQLVTYMWIHADFEGIGFLHLLFNMMTLYYFGKVVEQEVGAKHFLRIYLGGGIVAALSCLAELWVRYYYTGDSFFLNNGMVGASGSVFALVAVFVSLNPTAKLYLMFIPVGIPANRALFIFIGISVALMFFEATDFIAHSAHIGGMLFGYAYTKLFIRPQNGQDNVVPFPGSF